MHLYRFEKVLMLVILLGVASFYLYRQVQNRIQFARDAAEAVAFVQEVNQLLRHPPRNYREYEKWVPEDFFRSQAAVQACNALSSQDNEVLKELITAGLDLNQRGRSGATLLHWAFFEDNLKGFELLLESGANPDLKLTDFIELTRRAPFAYGDSIIFTAVREKKHDFFFAAVARTSDVNQLDGSGETFLLACASFFVLPGTSEETFQRIIDTGVDLNAKNKYGCTACDAVIVSNRPTLALMLLEAGADPTTGNNGTSSLVRLVQSQIANTKRAQPKSGLIAKYEKLLAWLEADEERRKASQKEQDQQANGGEMSNESFSASDRNVK